MENRARKLDLATVVMAAGQGKRMADPSLAKVLYEINGKPLIHYVVDLARELGTSPIAVIVGYQRQLVIEYLSKSHPMVTCAVQEPQLGTGHAVLQAGPALEGFRGNVLVLSGDVPMLRKETMEHLLAKHNGGGVVATILTALMTDPSGYGRIIRNEDSTVSRIVEHKDASDEERKISEINSGIYVFDKERLFEALGHLAPNNAQNEYYLTDVFEYFWRNGWKVSAVVADDLNEIHGINTHDQLEQARNILLARLVEKQ